MAENGVPPGLLSHVRRCILAIHASPENLPDADDFEQDDLVEQVRVLLYVSEALRADTAQLIEQLKLTLDEMKGLRERHRLN
jgi:hypothetical protein